MKAGTVNKEDDKPDEMAQRRTAIQCAVRCDRVASQAIEKLTNARMHVSNGNLVIASELIHNVRSALQSYHDYHCRPLRHCLVLDEPNYKPAHLTTEIPFYDKDLPTFGSVTVNVGAHGEPNFSFSTKKKEKKVELSAKTIKRLTKCLRNPKTGAEALRKILASVISETKKFW